MGKIREGNFNFGSILKVTTKGAIDNRQVVENKTDLIADIWEGYAYKGMLVIVANTGRAYILNDEAKIASSDYSGWTEIATSSSAAAAASVVQAASGQASYLEITSTADPTDGHMIYSVALKPVNLENATSSSTGVATAYDVKNYVDTAISGVNSTIEENEEVTAAALNELDGRVDALEAVSADYTVTVTESTPSGVAKRYTISQLGSSIGTIDIPKDLVVDEGKVVDVTYSEGHYWDGSTNIDEALVIDAQQEAGYLAGKYIRLIIANSQDLPLYIAAKDLVDIYTSGSSASSDIQVVISNNQITAQIGDSSALKTELDRLAGVETNAEVNIIESIKVNGTALDPDEDREVDLGYIASAAELERVERVASAAINDLNDRVEVVEGGVQNLDSEVEDLDSRLSEVEDKLDGVETGAEVNVIEGVKLTDAASALTPDANKIVTIPAASANQDGLMSSEDFSKLSGIASGAQVNVQADWNEADSNSDAYIANKPYIVKSYITSVTSGSSTTITAATHGCGAFPLVQVYSGNEVVTANISVDISANSDVTVAWEITPSAETPIRIRIVG